jgi:hypothetical protein
MTQAYPLHWPADWPRTQRRKSSRFRTTISKALNNVQDSLRKFSDDSGKKTESVVISSNVTLGQQRPGDPGVAIYFSWDGLSTCIAVDRYEKVEENLQAIHFVIEAERTKLRHGGLNIVRAAFRGYAALPPPSGAATAGKTCWDILELPIDSTVNAIKSAYKRKAKKCHPDTSSGDDSAMVALNAARDDALRQAAS